MRIWIVLFKTLVGGISVADGVPSFSHGVAMSVYIETSAGDVVVDLFTDECPEACKNFLKLCKYVFCFNGFVACFLASAIALTLMCRIKYYHNCLFFKVSRNFIAQSGDPHNDGSGGSSVFGYVIISCDHPF